jgi:uncharacterized membrane protein
MKMTILFHLFLGSGVLIMALSVPMILGKIPPNGLYGFRVKKTMENPDFWYPVNVYSGKWLMAIGLVMILASTVFFFVPGISLDVYAYAVLGVWVIVFSTAMVASVRYMNSL